jgi:hypothetical protein
MIAPRYEATLFGVECPRQARLSASGIKASEFLKLTARRRKVLFCAIPSVDRKKKKIDKSSRAF